MTKSEATNFWPKLLADALWAGYSSSDTVMTSFLRPEGRVPKGVLQCEGEKIVYKPLKGKQEVSLAENLWLCK